MNMSLVNQKMMIAPENYQFTGLRSPLHCDNQTRLSTLNKTVKAFRIDDYIRNEKERRLAHKQLS